MAAAGNDRFLLDVVRTISSTLDLDQVLDRVVELLTRAARVQACFVYLHDPHERSLVLRACSPEHAQLVGELRIPLGEGLVGWVFSHREPAFLHEGLATDPRVRFVPELDAGGFEAGAALPLLARDGSPLGVLGLHSATRREFGTGDSELLLAASSLIAGAIENATLHARLQARVATLEGLASLGDSIARAETLDGLLPVVVSRCASLIGARSVQIYLLDDASGNVRLAASAPPTAPAPGVISLRVRRGAEDDPQARVAAAVHGPAAGGPGSLVIQLLAQDELIGLLVARALEHAFAREDRDAAGSVASQTALAITRIHMVERLAERNLIKDFFEEVSRGHAGSDVLERGRRLGFDVERPHLVLCASHGGDDDGEEALEQLAASIARAARGTLCDRRDKALRALVPLGGVRSEDELVAAIRSAREQVAPRVVVGLSSPCQDVAALATGFDEAAQALAAAPAVGEAAATVTYDELGPYKYLLRITREGAVRDRHAEALRTLAAYDERRRSELVRTLEEFLRQRGNVTTTAAALYVHANTLRQRLRRIEDLTGIDVRDDDWLMIEIAIKVLYLERALMSGA